MGFDALDKFEAKLDAKTLLLHIHNFNDKKIAEQRFTKTRRSKECLPSGPSHLANWFHRIHLHYHAPMLRNKTGNCATFNFRNFWIALCTFPSTVFSNQSMDDVKHSDTLQVSKDITAFH
jgi:hypothetical protein